MQSTAKDRLSHPATTEDGCYIPLDGDDKNNDSSDSNHTPEDSSQSQLLSAASVSRGNSLEIAAQSPLNQDRAQHPASKFWGLIQATASAQACKPTAAAAAHALTQLPLPPLVHPPTATAAGARDCPCACPFCPINMAAPGGVCSVAAGLETHIGGATASSSHCAEEEASAKEVVEEDGEEGEGNEGKRAGKDTTLTATDKPACQNQSTGDAPDTDSRSPTMCEAKDENGAPNTPPSNAVSSSHTDTGIQHASSPHPLPSFSYFFGQLPAPPQFRKEYTGQEWTEDQPISPVYAERDVPSAQWYSSASDTEDDDTSYQDDCVMFWPNATKGALPTIIEEGTPLVDVSDDADGSSYPCDNRILLAGWPLEQAAAEPSYRQPQSPPSSPSPSSPLPISGVFTDPIWWVDQELGFSPPLLHVHYCRRDASGDGGDASCTSTSPSICSTRSDGCGDDSPSQSPSPSTSLAASTENDRSHPQRDWNPSSSKSAVRSDAQSRSADGEQCDSELDESLPQEHILSTGPRGGHATPEEDFLSGEDTPIAHTIPLPGSGDGSSVHSGCDKHGEPGCPWPRNAALRRYFRRVMNNENRSHDMKKRTKKKAKAGTE